MRPILRLTVLLPAALALTGCGGSLFKTEIPVAETYQLSAVAGEPAGAQPLDAVILVGRPMIAPGLDTDRIAVVKSDRRLDYYAASAALAPGVSEYAYAIGFERERYGVDSFNYGRPLVMGFYRLGLTSHLTAGFRAVTKMTGNCASPNTLLSASRSPSSRDCSFLSCSPTFPEKSVNISSCCFVGA